MYNFEIARQLALMQHLNEEYFFIEDKDNITFYKGNYEDNLQEFIEDHKTFGLSTEPYFKDWLNENKLVEEFNDEDYLVLTDNEANELCKERIKESIWAFRASFILDQCELDYDNKIQKSLEEIQGNLCESCNDFLLSLVEKTCGLDEFVKEANQSDCRGNFITYYDGQENSGFVEFENNEFFI